MHFAKVYVKLTVLIGGMGVSKIQERLKEQRLKKGYTLAQLAELLNVKEATVQRYESGEIKNIKHETITLLADILNCSPCYLMGWTDNELIEVKRKESPVIKKFDKLNHIDQLKTEAYIDGLLENPSYTLLKNEKYEYVAFTESETITDIDEDDDETKHT